MIHDKDIFVLFHVACLHQVRKDFVCYYCFCCCWYVCVCVLWFLWYLDLVNLIVKVKNYRACTFCACLCYIQMVIRQGLALLMKRTCKCWLSRKMWINKNNVRNNLWALLNPTLHENMFKQYSCIGDLANSIEDGFFGHQLECIQEKL
jgi:hypothetical protein